MRPSEMTMASTASCQMGTGSLEAAALPVDQAE